MAKRSIIRSATCCETAGCFVLRCARNVGTLSVFSNKKKCVRDFLIKLGCIVMRLDSLIMCVWFFLFCSLVSSRKVFGIDDVVVDITWGSVFRGYWMER